MNLYYSDIFDFPLPPDHRFPLQKYALLRAYLRKHGHIDPGNLIVPEAATDKQLLRVHSPAYLNRVVNGTLGSREVRRIGLPWSPELVKRSLHSVGGTIAAAHSALEDGVGFNLAGGTHHAHRDWGSGFCIFNDVAVAARDLQATASIERILIVDCDVHQGDGSASIFADDPSVYTFSIHGQSNFPFRKSASDLDIGLEAGTGDERYLETLSEALHGLFHDSGSFDFIFYLAGADPYHGDAFGHLNLTKAGLLARDQLLFDACQQAGLPVAVALAGGYAPDLKDLVEIHANTIAQALRFEQNV